MAIQVLNKMSNYSGHIGVPVVEAAAWEEATKNALDKIRSNRHGKGLMEDVEGSVNVVSIVKTGGKDPSNVTWIQGAASGGYISLNDAVSLEAALRAAEKKGGRVGTLREVVQQHASGIKWRGDRLEVERVELSDASDRALKCYLEQFDCLTPGTGANCCIRWNPNADFVGAETLDRKAPENKWRNRPAWIGLAHELIHAWRHLTGRQIFPVFGNSQEVLLDEALTTGVPPFMTGKYRENGIRYHAFQVARPFYGSDHGS